MSPSCHLKLDNVCVSILVTNFTSYSCLSDDLSLALIKISRIMTDLSGKSVAAATDANDSVDKITNDKISYWKQMLKNYKKRNASLERRRSALEERVRFMEYTLPSLLVGATASSIYDGKPEISNESSNIPENTLKSVAQEN